MSNTTYQEHHLLPKLDTRIVESLDEVLKDDPELAELYYGHPQTDRLAQGSQSPQDWWAQRRAERYKEHDNNADELDNPHQTRAEAYSTAAKQTVGLVLAEGAVGAGLVGLRYRYGHDVDANPLSTRDMLHNVPDYVFLSAKMLTYKARARLPSRQRDGAPEKNTEASSKALEKTARAALIGSVALSGYEVFRSVRDLSFLETPGSASTAMLASMMVPAALMAVGNTNINHTLNERLGTIAYSDSPAEAERRDIESDTDSMQHASNDAKGSRAVSLFSYFGELPETVATAAYGVVADGDIVAKRAVQGLPDHARAVLPKKLRDRYARSHTHSHDCGHHHHDSPPDKEPSKLASLYSTIDDAHESLILRPSIAISSGVRRVGRAARRLTERRTRSQGPVSSHRLTAMFAGAAAAYTAQRLDMNPSDAAQQLQALMPSNFTGSILPEQAEELPREITEPFEPSSENSIPSTSGDTASLQTSDTLVRDEPELTDTWYESFQADVATAESAFSGPTEFTVPRFNHATGEGTLEYYAKHILDMRGLRHEQHHINTLVGSIARDNAVDNPDVINVGMRLNLGQNTRTALLEIASSSAPSS